MLFAIFLFLFVQGFASSEDEYDLYRNCNKILLPVYNRTRDEIPDAEEIAFRCPPTKEFLDCRIAHFATEFDSQFNLGDFIVAKNFLEEMCDENSDIYKVYIDNVDCYRSMVNEWDGCKKIAEDVFSEYRASSFAFQNTDIEELDEEEREIAEHRFFFESRCLVNSHTTACIGTKILETCGFDAFQTFLEMFVGLRWKNFFCGKGEENLFIKGFLDFLADENKIVENVLIRTMFEIEDK